MSESTLVPPAFSTSQVDDSFTFHKCDTLVHNRSHYLGPEFDKKRGLEESLSIYYAVPELVGFFKAHLQYRKITLQFPDDLVFDSAIVAQLLQDALVDLKCYSPTHENIKKVNSCSCKSFKQCSDGQLKASSRQIWVLADTSYSLCCVDEVAAEHVGADIIVHFGDSCLNAIQKLPVVYSFGRPYLDLDVVGMKFMEAFPDTESYVCIMADTAYSYILKTVYQVLTDKGYTKLLFAGINMDFLDESATIVGYDMDVSDLHMVYTLGNRKLFSNCAISQENNEELTLSYHLFHIAMPQDPRLLFLSTKFRSTTIFIPGKDKLMTGPFPTMMRRYRYMHIARTAGTIGLLVNTLSLKNVTELMNSLIKLIKKSGKKHYMFVVGKPNVAKLANFEAIDIWCILGCSQSGIILDQQNEYYKPIITPYELTLALSPELTWTNKWVVGFDEVLKEVDSMHENNQEDQSDAPEFDAVTGRYISTSKPLRNIGHLELEYPTADDHTSSTTKSLAKSSNNLSVADKFSTSTAFLQSRIWSGLGSDYQDEHYEKEGATVEEGVLGIARGYYHRNVNPNPQ